MGVGQRVALPVLSPLFWVSARLAAVLLPMCAVRGAAAGCTYRRACSDRSRVETDAYVVIGSALETMTAVFGLFSGMTPRLVSV